MVQTPIQPELETLYPDSDSKPMADNTRTDFDNIPPKFLHPLAEWGQIIETEDGRQEPTCNLWATASLFTWQYYEGNSKAEALILDCIQAGGECDNPIPLLMKVRLGQDEAIQNCITYIQGGLMRKMDEAFKQ